MEVGGLDGISTTHHLPSRTSYLNQQNYLNCFCPAGIAMNRDVVLSASQGRIRTFLK